MVSAIPPHKPAVLPPGPSVTGQAGQPARSGPAIRLLRGSAPAPGHIQLLATHLTRIAAGAPPRCVGQSTDAPAALLRARGGRPDAA